MKSSQKGKKFDYISIVKININPEILNQREKTASSVSQQRKNKYSHKKLNSANNHNSKFRENKNITNSTQNTTLSNTSIQTPEINTHYKMRLEKLNSNISFLKNKYEDLIKKNFENNNRMDSFKLRFLKVQKNEEDKKINKRRQEYLNVKKAKLRQELEKNLKVKKECRENKQKDFYEKKDEVQKRRHQESNDYDRLKKKKEMNQENKKRIKEEEKKYIEDELKLQKSKNLKDMEKKRTLNKEKEMKKEERMLGNQVYALTQIEKDLKSKIKVQKAINNKMNKQYYHYVQTKINDENVKNSY
jgi:hypothetical protein